MNSLLDRSLNDVRKSRDNEAGSARVTFGKQKPAAPAPPGNVNERWQHDMHNPSPAAPAPAARQYSYRQVEDDPRGRLPNLLIKNLHYDVSERELQALFSQIGRIAQGPAIKYPSLDRSIGEDQRPFRRLVVVVVSRFEHGIVKELTESIIFYLLCGLSPLVAQWDREGRSRGLAYIGYENETYAEQALHAFDGAPAKEQRISIQYIAKPPLWSHRQLGIFENDAELLGRIQGGAREQRRAAADSPYASSYRDHRDRPDISARGATRGRGVASRGGGISARGSAGVRGRGGRGGGRGGKREQTTAADLDKELEAFMQEPGGGAKADDVQMQG